MEYQEARYIRQMPSLSDLIRREAVYGRKGVFGSVKEALKQKFNVKRRLQAKMVGIKEKFDPMYWARSMFGKTGAALYGRAMGRSEADMQYFAGRARPLGGRSYQIGEVPKYRGYEPVKGGTGEGGGTQPGTRINTTRLFPTVNTNQTVFTTPTYTAGTGQLRVYIDGVRQYPSDYTETSSTSVTLGSTIPAGSSLMIEVDAYTSYAYYANNITFTAPQGSIPSSANTIQLAIDSLESRKAALVGASFTGVATGLTLDANTSNTAMATTAFVKNVLNVNPIPKTGIILGSTSLICPLRKVP